MTKCELFEMIPKSEIDRVFRGTAAAELSSDFMGFEDAYKVASIMVPKSWDIIDLGCGYAAQAYYFTKHLRYFAVDAPAWSDVIRFKTDNMKLYVMTIQEFVEKHLDDFDLNCTFAICSAVPDEDARNTVAEYFPNRYIWYPGGDTDVKLKVKR